MDGVVGGVDQKPGGITRVSLVEMCQPIATMTPGCGPSIVRVPAGTTVPLDGRKRKHRNRVAILLILALLPMTGWLLGGGIREDHCRYWESIVDPTIECPDIRLAWSDDAHVVEAIGCLLQLEGRTWPGNFSGATNPKVSDFLERATVEIGALYLATYLYYQKPDCVNGVVLLDKKGEHNTPQAVREAFRFYRKWFRQLKKIGISNARKQGLDPLNGSDISWY